MPVQKIVTGQPVSEEYKRRAKELRHKMTQAEHMLWQRLRANRLGGFHFRRQKVIDHYIVDFYCHQANLVVELDGSGHLDQQEYDNERDQHLQERGLKVLRFWNNEVEHDLDGVLSVILDSSNLQVSG